MSARHGQAYRWKRNLMSFPADKICKHMSLDMVYRDIGNLQSVRKSFCHAHTNKEWRHKSGELGTGNHIYLFKGQICFTKNFFEYSKYIIGVQPRGYLWHHSLRLIVLTNLRSGLHDHKPPITKYRNRGVVTRGFKSKKEHGCLIIEIFCL